jgi:hypothetical protein
MSYTSLASKFAASAMALTMGGCAVVGDRTAGLQKQQITSVPEMSQPVASYDPCTSVGIEARLANEVSPWERAQNRRAGREERQYGSYVLFSEPSRMADFSRLVGAALGGLAGATVGGGSARNLAIAGGATAGAIFGDKFSGNGRTNYLVDLNACQQFLSTKAGFNRDYYPQPQQPAGRTIYNGYYPDGRPIVIPSPR